MTLNDIKRILEQGKELGTVTSIYFEGGEPFLYYPIMLKGIQWGVEMGFNVGIVTNSYWATSLQDALEWLRPLKGLLSDISVSSDLFHYSEKLSRHTKYACQAAEEMEIPIGVISVAQPEDINAAQAIGTLPAGESGIMYRGRAAEALVPRAVLHPWTQFTNCPYEDLTDPGRVHVDPFGNIHICQGISLGNLFHTPLKEICNNYNPVSHPITGPLLKGGPAELIRHHQLPHDDKYADACHLCYKA
jgi:MoaA/NifB/PqqE/SkfB family radical SAM enzyme